MVTVTYIKFIKKLWQDGSNAIYSMRIGSWFRDATKTLQGEKFLPVVWSESMVDIKDVGTVDIPEEEKVKKSKDIALSVCLYFQQETNVSLT